jgi:hypothetical protein
MFRHHPLQFNSPNIRSEIIPLQALPINRGFFFIAAIPFLIMNDLFSMGSFWKRQHQGAYGIEAYFTNARLCRLQLEHMFTIGAEQVFPLYFFDHITRVSLGVEIM